MKRSPLRCFEYTDWSSGKKDAKEPITCFKSMHLSSVMLSLPWLKIIFESASDYVLFLIRE
jgi:hypothetical protein